MKRTKDLLTKYTLGGKWSTRKAYVPFMGSNGRWLTEEEIIFTDKAGYMARQQSDGWDDLVGEDSELVVSGEYSIGEFTIFSEGVEPIYDELGNFPIALRTPKGVADVKMSAITGEVLPTHAGCCQVIYVMMVGAAQSGKTCLELNMMDRGYHNMFSRGGKVSFKEDAPFVSECRKGYKKKLKEMRDNHNLPEPGRQAENFEPFYFLVRKGEDAAILVLKDIDGEHYREMDWNDPILLNNQFIFVIGADEILKADSANETMFEHIFDQMVDRLNVRTHDDDFHFMVMISKCDLLLNADAELKKKYENSMSTKDGRWVQTIHGDGFDCKRFAQREAMIKEILQDKVPGFYTMLMDYIGEDKVSFCMAASVGAECKDRHFDKFEPFSIDEPMAVLLKDLNIYPIAVNEIPEPEDVRTISGRSEVFRKLVDKLKNILVKGFKCD